MAVLAEIGQRTVQTYSSAHGKGLGKVLRGRVKWRVRLHHPCPVSRRTTLRSEDTQGMAISDGHPRTMANGSRHAFSA